MKKFHRLLLGYALALLPCLTSCGLIDMDFDAETQQVTSISFVYDTVYVMERDTFFLAPYFYPDTTAIQTVAWEAEDPNVVHCLGDTIVADSVGTTHVMVTTLLNHRSDTCLVNVMPRWEITPWSHLYDEVVYVDVDLGKHLTFNPKSMILGAFSFGECIGVGEVKTTPSGRTYTVVRCWTDFVDDEDDEDISNIYFKIYYKNTLQVDIMEQVVPLDGETHGTPSNPIKLTIEK